MLPLYPVNPIKGRGAVRIAVNCWYTTDKERVVLAAQFRPFHHIKTRGKHYLSPEAYREPISELRMLAKECEFNNAVFDKPTTTKKLIRELLTTIKKYEKLND